ncbi:class I SAM-dependent methyltransferase [Candidatus Contubernalis alkaliaceticus]|uniref:class I SAM-dependent methyltransferase n=1 Tax=Candidatus Contubernalis alkaliaceticus TaxID=338645 RepID=UPI001F4C1869|nr:class I SAM-dependent methyltransferase [Candidatus Contubernalis alkalaceticus]UNC93036.1 class I SAM-dependent methyltransferase [Candidatus Contubernalis alkalaceticus]
MGNEQIQINHQINSPELWEEIWNRAREESLLRRKRKSLKDTVNHWNKRAKKFEKNVTGEKGRRRIGRVFNWLENQGVNFDNMRVLDIGAGPGAFAQAFAGRVKDVVALEPAEAMVTFLKEQIEINKINNIRVIQDTWEEVNLEEHNLEQQFDLVFASMSPGINNRDTIDKALRCAKKYCFISSHAGKRQNDALSELWQTLYGETIPSWPGNIVYIFNFLYARGFQMSFEVWEEKRMQENTPEEAVSSLKEELLLYGVEDPFKEDERIIEFVNNKAVNGIFRQEHTVRQGQLLIKL